MDVLVHERASNTYLNLIKMKKIPCKDQACVLLVVLIMKTQVCKLFLQGNPRTWMDNHVLQVC